MADEFYEVVGQLERAKEEYDNLARQRGELDWQMDNTNNEREKAQLRKKFDALAAKMEELDKKEKVLKKRLDQLAKKR